MDPNLVKALTGYFPQLLPELVLGVAACVLFLGGTWRANRCLWGWAALISLGLAGLGLWYSSSHVPTVESSAVEVKELTHAVEKISKDRLAAKDAAEAKSLSEDQAAAKSKLETKAGEFNAQQYSSPVLNTGLATFIRWLALLITVVLVLFAWDEVPASHAAEYHACLLLIAAGTGLTAAANDLITLFLALELISIPTYIVLYLPRVDGQAREAAMKYFLLSVFSSGLLLFGFSYLYGLGGTTNLAALADALQTRLDHPMGAPRGVLLMALVLVLAGLGFRIAAVPFHFYAPDVYQGTATPNAALLAVIPKVAGFIALVRILLLVPPVAAVINVTQPVLTFGTPGYDPQIPVVLWIMAAVTMSLGNVLALLQDNIKRLMAYSSVAHAGYMLIGLTAATRLGGRADVAVGGVEGVLFYLVSYGAMTIGTFAMLTYLSSPEKQVEKVDDLAGLGRHRPGASLLMTLFLLSLIGMPLTAGFFGKMFLFFGAMQTPLALFPTKDATALDQNQLFNILVLIGAVNAAIGGWYYLRLIAYMYLRDAAKAPVAGKFRPVLAAIWICAVVTVFVGVYPKPLLDKVKSVVRVVPEPKPDEPATAQR